MNRKRMHAGVLLVIVVFAVSMLWGPLPTQEPSESGPSSGSSVPILLVLPLERNGRFELEMQNAAEFTELYFSIWTPEGIGVAATNKVIEDLRAMAPWDPEGVIVGNPDHIKKVSRFFGATHVLSGSWESKDGQWLAHCLLTMPDGEAATDFHVPEGNDIELASRMAKWILAETQWKLPPEGAKYFEAPIFGPELVSTRSEQYKAFVDPYDTAVSTQILLGDIENTAAWYWMLLSRWETRSPSALIGQATGLGNQEAGMPSADLISGMASRLVRGPVAGTPAYLKYLSVHPNSSRHATFFAFTFHNALLFERFDQPVNWEHYASSMEEWSKSAAKTPANKSYLALAYGMASSGWRGTGYSVSPKQRQKWSQYGVSARELYDAVQKEIGTYPWVTCNVLSWQGQAGNRAGAEETLEALKQSLPDYDRPWEYALTYARPRWGGTHEKAFGMIEEAMRSRPENGSFGKLAYVYCVDEALKETGNDNDMLLNFAKKYPRAGALLRQGAQRTWEKYGNREGAAFSYTIATLLGEREIARTIAMQYPNFPEEKKESFANLWFGRAWFCMIEDYFLNGQWEALAGATARFNKHEMLAQHVDTVFSVFLSEDPTHLEAYTGLAQAMNGGYQEAGYLLETAREKFSDRPWMLMLVEAVANPDAKEALEGLATESAEKVLGPKEHAALAIAAARAERPDAAKAYLAKLPPDWKCDVPAIVQEAAKVGLVIPAAEPMKVDFLRNLKK